MTSCTTPKQCATVLTTGHFVCGQRVTSIRTRRATNPAKYYAWQKGAHAEPQEGGSGATSPYFASHNQTLAHTKASAFFSDYFLAAFEFVSVVQLPGHSVTCFGLSSREHTTICGSRN
jgi:hypothetical protein